MQVSISIPEDIGQFITANPNAGRKVLEKRFRISVFLARFYAHIAKLYAERNGEDTVLDMGIFDKLDVDEKYSPGNSGSIEVRGRCLESDFDKTKIIGKAIDEAGINSKKWIIKDIRVKKWHTSMKLRTLVGDEKGQFIEKPHQIVNWAVSIMLKPNEAEPYLDAFEEIAKKVRPLPKVNHQKLPKKHDLAGVLAPVDAHIGKLAWGAETLGGNMDLNIATKHFYNACMSNLEKMQRHGMSKIFVVLGHDLLHIENQTGETPKGKHSLDYDGRLSKIIEGAENVTIDVIDQCVQIAPTEVIWVPGNHDWHASLWLCRLLKRYYSNNPHVGVDVGPSMRKMILWGDTLIGLVHEAEGRKRAPTVNLMAQHDPWKRHWSKARWTELHTGHLHKREVVTVGGTIWRRLSALSTIDFWHTEGVYTDAIPACESFMYHKKDGLYAEYITNVDYLKDAA